MKTITEKNYNITANNEKWNNLNISIYYSLGGMNYFSGKVEKRGYYFSIHRKKFPGDSIPILLTAAGKLLLKRLSARPKSRIR